jgi:hypothetical protein
VSECCRLYLLPRPPATVPLVCCTCSRRQTAGGHVSALAGSCCFMGAANECIVPSVPVFAAAAAAHAHASSVGHTEVLCKAAAAKALLFGAGQHGSCMCAAWQPPSASAERCIRSQLLQQGLTAPLSMPCPGQQPCSSPHLLPLPVCQPVPLADAGVWQCYVHVTVHQGHVLQQVLLNRGCCCVLQG